MNKTTLWGTALLLAATAGSALAQSGGTSQTEDEQNMTAGAATHGTKTDFQDKLQAAYSDYGAGRYPQATAELKAVLKKDPGNLTANQMLAGVYLKQNMAAEAIPELEAVVEALPKDSKDMTWQNNLGVAYLQDHQYGKAATVFKGVQARNPKDPKTAYYLGVALAQSGKLDEAVPALQNAAKLDPSAQAYSALGMALEQQEKHADAAAAFQSAADKDPKNAQAALDAGLLFHEAGQDDKAVPDLKRALDLGTSDALDAHEALASAYDKAGKGDDALAEYKLGSAANPSNFGAAASLGYAYERANKKPEAEAAYRAALALKGTSAEEQAQIQDALGQMLAEGDGADEAVTLLTQATQAVPTNAGYQSDLGQVYEKQGKKDLALAAYARALALDPHQLMAKAGTARLTAKKP